MDESIEIATPQDQGRPELNSRMRALLEAPPFEPEPEPNSDSRHQTAFRIDEDDANDDDYHHNYLMDADLYNSAEQGGGHVFLDVLERVSKSNKVRINRLLITVSLAGDTVLHVAARNGNADVVDLIITHFPSLLNEVNFIGDTAVHVAAKAGEVSVLKVINSKRKEFLNSGGHIFCGLTNTKVAWSDDSLKETNRKGNTPLHEALINGHPNLAVELVEEDVSVSIVRNVEGKSAFYLAAEAGYFDCLLVMMDYAEHEGIDLRQVGKSPIHAVILGKDIGELRQELNSRMRALLEAPPFEPKPEPNSGNCHQIVIQIEDDDVSDDDHYNYNHNYLMDVNLYNSAKQDGGHAFLDVLERVSKSNKVPINRLLKTVSLARDTLLHVAASNGNADIVDLIITHFPSLLNEVNLIGDTVVHVAAKAGDVSVLQVINSKRKEFLNSGSLIFCGLTNTQVEWKDDLLKVKNKQGNTPLHEALINRHENLAVELVEEDVSVSVVPNVEGKSAFYPAAEAGHIDCLLVMMEYVKHEGINLRQVGKSPIHAAILGGSIGALLIMLRNQPGLINLRDDERRTPLHFAALMGYKYEVVYLIRWNNQNVFKKDKYGQLPIHLASMNGHIYVIEQLLDQRYYPHELLNGKGQNILHVAAKCGRYEVVIYILKLKHSQELNLLINQKDDDGNTPLHLATMKSHPKIVSALTWDKRMDLDSSNNDNLTALDVAQNYKYGIVTFQQRLTWLSLKASGASLFNPGMQSKSPITDNNTNKQPLSSVDLKQISSDNNNRVNTLLLVSTLIVTVTFAAGFTMPGGNNNTEPNMGGANMIKHSMFQLFVFSDTAAMFTSLLVAVALIFVQGDISMTDAVLRFALPILAIALAMMALAFMTGVSLAVSKSIWLSKTIMIIAILFMTGIALIFFPISTSFIPRHRIFQYIITFIIFKMT